jgi:hypothetical protein
MNTRPWLLILLAASLLELGGCKNLLKKRDPDAAPSAAPVAVVAPSATVAPVPTAPAVPEPPPALPVADEATVPTSQDFEDDAFAKITPANFRAQFAQIKAEVTKP